VEPRDEPHPNLTGNVRWLAARMKVKLAPSMHPAKGKRNSALFSNV
jgi:hypothetical protein